MPDTDADDTKRRNPLRIENSERGITLTKSLAWTIAVGLINGSIYLGMQVAAVQAELSSISASMEKSDKERGELEVRLWTVEMSDTATKRDVSAMTDKIDDIKRDQQEILGLLRRVTEE